MHISRFADAHHFDHRHTSSTTEPGAPAGEPLQPRRQMPRAVPTPASFADCALHDVRSGLRATVARESAEFGAARELVEQRYTARGYQCMSDAGRPVRETHAVTLLATHNGTTVGTMTLRFDSPRGLNVDEACSAVVGALRAAGGVACELTCLALAPEADSQATLAVLFRLAYFIGDKLDVTDVFIEVNPRHERFYKRVLGFDTAAGERMCPRVQAPAVLLHQDMIQLGVRLGGFPPPTRHGAELTAA